MGETHEVVIAVGDRDAAEDVRDGIRIKDDAIEIREVE